jgi:hypothetical protein
LDKWWCKYLHLQYFHSAITWVQNQKLQVYAFSIRGWSCFGKIDFRLWYLEPCMESWTGTFRWAEAVCSRSPLQVRSAIKVRKRTLHRVVRKAELQGRSVTLPWFICWLKKIAISSMF